MVVISMKTLNYILAILAETDVELVYFLSGKKPIFIFLFILSDKFLTKRDPC